MILVHLELKAWSVTLDFKLLFPVYHRLRVNPTPRQYFCLGWNPALNSEAGGYDSGGESTKGDDASRVPWECPNYYIATRNSLLHVNFAYSSLHIAPIRDGEVYV